MMETKKIRKQQFGLVALSLIMFVVTIDTTITNIALPTITDYFKTNLTDSNWVSTVYVLILSVLMIPAAKLADQLGRKKIMLIGLSIFGLGSLMCALSSSLSFLISMRFLQGVGGAIAMPVEIPLAVDLLGRAKANKSVGIIGAVAAIAAASGPVIGGLLIHLWSWHAIFYINVPIVLITIVLIAVCFGESFDESVSKRIDLIGIILLSIALFFLTFVLLKGYDYGWLSKKILLMLFGSILSTCLFVITERKKAEPLIEYKLFKDPTFFSSTVIYFLCGFTIVCSSVVFNFFLENIKNYSPLHAAYIIMFTSIMTMIAMPIGSQLGQKLNYCWVIVFGVFLTSISLLLLTQLSMDMSVFTMAFDMCVLGLGFGLSSLALISAVQYIPEEKAGIASGMVNAGRQLGTCLGIALLVGLLNNNIDYSFQQTQSYSIKVIEKSNISDPLKQISKRQVKKLFVLSNYNNALEKQKLLIAKSRIKYVFLRKKSIPKPQKGSGLRKLYKANQQLIIESKKSGKNNTFIVEQQSLSQVISLIGEKQELQKIFKQTKQEENRQIIKAFKKTYLCAFVLITVCIPVSFFTDKK